MIVARTAWPFRRIDISRKKVEMGEFDRLFGEFATLRRRLLGDFFLLCMERLEVLGAICGAMMDELMGVSRSRPPLERCVFKETRFFCKRRVLL